MIPFNAFQASGFNGFVDSGFHARGGEPWPLMFCYHAGASIMCVNPETGEQVWQTDVTGMTTGTPYPELALSRDYVFFSRGGTTVAKLNKATGEQVGVSDVSTTIGTLTASKVAGVAANQYGELWVVLQGDGVAATVYRLMDLDFSLIDESAANDVPRSLSRRTSTKATPNGDIQYAANGLYSVDRETFNFTVLSPRPGNHYYTVLSESETESVTVLLRIDPEASGPTGTTHVSVGGSYHRPLGTSNLNESAGPCLTNGVAYLPRVGFDQAIFKTASAALLLSRKPSEIDPTLGTSFSVRQLLTDNQRVYIYGVTGGDGTVLVTDLDLNLIHRHVFSPLYGKAMLNLPGGGWNTYDSYPKFAEYVS